MNQVQTIYINTLLADASYVSVKDGVVEATCLSKNSIIKKQKWI